MTVSKQFEKLEAFVYVSSIYANCDHSYIEEKIYPSHVEPQKILNILEFVDFTRILILIPIIELFTF